MEKFKKYFLFFITFAFAGYVWEVFYTFVRNGIIINVGTLIGPWLPIYGAGGLIIYFIYKKVKTNVFGLFIISCLTSFVIEYSTSLYLEVIYHKRWWDYSNKPLNLNGRVWLTGILFFGLFAIFCIKLVLPFLDKLYDKIKGKKLTIFIYTVLVLFCIDYIYCTISPNTMDAKEVSFIVNDVDFNYI